MAFAHPSPSTVMTVIEVHDSNHINNGGDVSVHIVFISYQKCNLQIIYDMAHIDHTWFHQSIAELKMCIESS